MRTPPPSPQPPAGLDGEQFRQWIEYQEGLERRVLEANEKRRNQHLGLVVVFGVMLIVAATAILLVWSPWN